MINYRIDTEAREDVAAIAHLPSVNVSGDKTLALADDGVYQNCTAAAVITVPPNDDVAFLAGTQIPIFADTDGVVSIAAGTGVTIKYNTGLKITGQNAGATLYKIATNTWHLIGALKA